MEFRASLNHRDTGYGCSTANLQKMILEIKWSKECNLSEELVVVREI